MQVAKWGNSLAVRLPAVVVEALDLREGDDIEIEVAGDRAIEIRKKPEARELVWPGSGSTVADSPLISSSTGLKPMPGTKPFFDTNILLHLFVYVFP